jgi:hypothetical protein
MDIPSGYMLTGYVLIIITSAVWFIRIRLAA